MRSYAAECAWRAARYMAARRPDYRPMKASEVVEGDGLRLVPGPGHPVPIALVQPLLAVQVSHEFGLAAITVCERSAIVDDLLYGVSAPTHTTVLYDGDYPVLVR